MLQEFPESSGGGSLDLSKPSVHGLIHYLRNLPEGFQWNFFKCDNCAMGVARTVWPEHIAKPSVENVTKAIGIPESYGQDLFVSRGIHTSRSPTPEAIAEDLEKIALVFA